MSCYDGVRINAGDGRRCRLLLCSIGREDYVGELETATIILVPGKSTRVARSVCVLEMQRPKGKIIFSRTRHSSGRLRKNRKACGISGSHDKRILRRHRAGAKAQNEQKLPPVAPLSSVQASSTGTWKKYCFQNRQAGQLNISFKFPRTLLSPESIAQAGRTAQQFYLPLFLPRGDHCLARIGKLFPESVSI